jgi:hypothetical protein
MLGKPLVRFWEGSARNSGHGRDIVAPPGNQAVNREHQLRPTAWGVPDLLETLNRFPVSGVRIYLEPSAKREHNLARQII